MLDVSATIILNMKLSRPERVLLSNQYKILSILDHNNKPHYEQSRQVVEEGYELNYDQISQHVNHDIMTIDNCNEVLHILRMFSQLKRSYTALKKKKHADGIDEHALKFQGFDFNDREEGLYGGYAMFCCQDGKFAEVDKGDQFNSHSLMLRRYRKMLETWRQITATKPRMEYELSKDEINKIIAY